MFFDALAIFDSIISFVEIEYRFKSNLLAAVWEVNGLCRFDDEKLSEQPCPTFCFSAQVTSPRIVEFS